MAGLSVRGTDHRHLIQASDEGRYLFGSDCAGTNGWVRDRATYGIATTVEGQRRRCRSWRGAV